MGNAEFKATFAQVQSEDFDISKLNDFKEKLWNSEALTNDFHEFEDIARCHGMSYYSLFKVLSEVRDDQKDLPEPKKRLHAEVIRDITAGYTTSESKLSQLVQKGKPRREIALCGNLSILCICFRLRCI